VNAFKRETKELEDPSPRSWLKPFLKPITPVFREIVAMSFFVNLLALAVPVFTLQVYDRVVYNAGISTLQGLLVGMMLVLVFDYVLRQSRARILQTVALQVDVMLGRRLFRKLMRLPLQTLESQPSDYWSSLFRDVDTVRNTLSGASALLVADLPFAILFLVLIFVIAQPVAWVLLIILPVFMFVAWRSAGAMAEASGRERKSTQSRDSLIGEMIAGRTTIKALALHRTMEPVWEEKHASNIETSVMRGAKTDSFSNLGATLSLITSILLTTVGALAIIDQRLTIGALIATNMLSGRILGPLNQLVGTWRTYSGFIQSVERLGNIFESEGEREVSEVKLEKPKGNISCDGVIFSYSANSAPVISGITVDIPKGGVHALVGRNGSGKTTLLKIIQGLYRPQKGRVMLDGADIAQFSRAELSDWLGYVPQESVLFAGTVRDNIASRRPNASDDEIIKAATEAGVHHFIIDLPDGYATEIGEAGSRLSGGQRQRIAIARALVGDPPVVLLDEPSSSLDRHAEFELKKTLKEISETRTVIMVTHSPTLLSVCDFLYALDKGKLALAGPAKDILPRLFGGKVPDAGPEPKQDAPPPKEAATKGLATAKEIASKAVAGARPAQGNPIGKIEPKRIAVPANNEVEAKKSPLAKEISEKVSKLTKRGASSAAMPTKRGAPEITPPIPPASKPMPKIVVGAKKRPNTAQILKAWNEGKPLPITRKNAAGSRARSGTISRSTPKLRGGPNSTRPSPAGE